MKRLVLSFLLTFSVFYSIKSQDTAFYNYLLKNQLFADAEYYLKQTLTTDSAHYDDLYFQLGLVKVEQEQNDSAQYYLQKINSMEKLPKAAVFLAQLLIEKGLNDSASIILSKIDTSVCSQNLKEHIKLQRSAIVLLKRDLINFEKSYEVLQSEKQIALYESFKKQTKIKKKSPLIAGALSAIIPGLGKVYGGTPRQGLSAFLTTTIMASQCVEGYIKGGWKDPRFIAFGALTGVFYVSNIYGSAIGINVSKRQQNNQIDHEIKITASLPISYFFK